ncbi:GNAT family N-acetyltransferase [Nocardioides limicola]|uniref:GNAT family N-acetyltransferase n=1 Tax=Nocardioides limicola TaxID=2803368 RepID=UPI00193BCA21|nr:GNAT family N-acetyltransferase [Nocardioides sp. DJM-14]
MEQAHFIEPDARVHRSFLDAMDEFAAEGRAGDNSMIGAEIAEWAPGWQEPEVFEAYTRQLRADALEETPRAAGWVPCTTLWWVQGDDYLGRLAIRHRLTRHLREVGGHIGYDVRASRRREGHGTAMLAAALPVAGQLGIAQALVTCDVDNVASRRTIERNGGVLEDQCGNKLRFWVRTR